MNTTPEIKKDDAFFGQLNAMTKERKDAQEAQERTTAEEAESKARDIRAARRWRCVFNLSLCAVIVAALFTLYATGHISIMVSTYGIGTCLVAVGWHMNEAKRAFRRKG